MRIVLDLEADNLLVYATKTWIVGFLNKDTGEVKYWLNGDMGWVEELDKATVIIGHNLCGYDLPLLYKLFRWQPKPGTKIQDTMIMSLVTNYNRFPNSQHSLGNWGELLRSPKLPSPDFSRYSEEMLTYWKQDLVVTNKVHDIVFSEYQAIAAKNPTIGWYLKAENAAAKWCALAELYGWPFNVEAAKELLKKLELELESTRAKILPLLGTKTVAIDKKNGIVEPKKCKWVKSGAYAKTVSDWFNIDPFSGQDEDRLVEGDYSRIEFVDLDLDSVTDVKIFLFRHGWEPTEWNWKENPNPNIREKVKSSPKITEDSLECMEGNGKIYCEFLTNKSRHSLIKGWIEACDENGNLHGGCFTIGTPSMRARHSLVVNVPAAESVWGPEIRALFICRPGEKLIGCDSAGNQARGLAHYLESPEFTDQLLNGDIHTFNATILDKVLADMGVDWSEYLKKKGVVEDHLAKRKRAAAKRILYAFLFGASGGKLWSYIFDSPNDKDGKKLKVGFTKAVPGFKALQEKLENIFGKTKQYGDGYIPGIAGNKIFCDSFHKLLVYLLQACEKATCAAALMLTMERLEAAGIPYIPCIFMHDEIDFRVPEEHAEEAAKIGKQAFVDGPKLFGVAIMDGDAKIGNNWYEIH